MSYRGYNCKEGCNVCVRDSGSAHKEHQSGRERQIKRMFSAGGAEEARDALGWRDERGCGRDENWFDEP